MFVVLAGDMWVNNGERHAGLHDVLDVAEAVTFDHLTEVRTVIVLLVPDERVLRVFIDS